MGEGGGGLRGVRLRACCGEVRTLGVVSSPSLRDDHMLLGKTVCYDN